MLSSLLLALREGVEAALVVGLLFGGLRKLQRMDLAASIWYGVLSAVIVSALAAAGLTLAGIELEGPAEVIFEGSALLAAAALLTWMIFWMHRQSRFLKGRIEANVRQAVSGVELATGKRALFGVAFLAVVREGIELALFLAAAGLATNPRQELGGAIIGLAAAVGIGWLLFSSTRRLPLSAFFQVTNILLIVFAAGLVAHGVHEFNEIGWIPAVIDQVYNLNPLVGQNSLLGQVLAASVSYNATPSLTEMVAYLLYFAVLTVSLLWMQRRTVTRAVQG
jgi:high-affinity iron transporter